MSKIFVLALLCLAPRTVIAANGFELDGLKAGDVRYYGVPEASLPADAEKKPASGPEYTVYNPVGTSSVTVSNHTGLMWLTNPDDAGLGGTYSREEALKVCEELNYAGYGDWRLPTAGELTAIVNVNGPYPGNNGFFLNSKSKYWTSTPPVFSAAFAWSLQFAVGSTYNIGSFGRNYVRCVRSRHSGA